MKSKDSEASRTWSIIDTVLRIKGRLATINITQEITDSLVKQKGQPTVEGCNGRSETDRIPARGHRNTLTCWRPPAGSVRYMHPL